MSADLIEYLGIPYKNQGRDRTGIDCWGFVLLAYKERLGVALWDPRIDYAPDWARNGANYLIQHHSEEWSEVKDPKPMDIVAFRNSFGIVNHVGLVRDRHHFVHCPKAGVVLGRMADRPWADRFVAFYRHRSQP